MNTRYSLHDQHRGHSCVVSVVDCVACADTVGFWDMILRPCLQLGGCFMFSGDVTLQHQVRRWVQTIMMRVWRRCSTSTSDSSPVATAYLAITDLAHSALDVCNGISWPDEADCKVGYLLDEGLQQCTHLPAQKRRECCSPLVISCSRHCSCSIYIDM